MLILWNRLKGKETTKLLQFRYFTELLQFNCAMFAWKLPPGLRPDYAEKYLNANGIFGVKETRDGFKIGMGGTGGRLDQYGIGDTFNGNTLGGEDEYLWGRIGETVAICWHNSMHTPNLDISRTAETLAEYDKSIFRITQMARANPIFSVKDEQAGKTIEGAATRIIDGDLVAVLSDNNLAALADGRPVEKIDITDPRYSEYLQFLNEGKDNEYRRYYQKYGHAMQSSSKHTTTLIDELHGADSVSFVAPLDMLKCRREFCEMANGIFGGGFSVDFSDVFKIEYEKYLRESETEPETETEPENETETGAET